MTVCVVLASLRAAFVSWLRTRGHLRTVVLAMPICELGHPNGFVVLAQMVHLIRQSVVVPTECQVIDLRIAAVVREGQFRVSPHA